MYSWGSKASKSYFYGSLCYTFWGWVFISIWGKGGPFTSIIYLTMLMTWRQIWGCTGISLNTRQGLHNGREYVGKTRWNEPKLSASRKDQMNIHEEESQHTILWTWACYFTLVTVNLKWPILFPLSLKVSL